MSNQCCLLISHNSEPRNEEFSGAAGQEREWERKRTLSNAVLTSLFDLWGQGITGSLDWSGTCWIAQAFLGLKILVSCMVPP